MCANAPGGRAARMARCWAAVMGGGRGGPVVCENKGGACGNSGMGFVARSEPDGYTIGLTTSA